MLWIKSIATELEESVANPDLDIDTELPLCGNCFVCKKCHGKQFYKDGMKMLLFQVLGVKEGIEEEITTNNTMAVIWKKEDKSKNTFNVKHPRVGDVEATVLNLLLPA